MKLLVSLVLVAVHTVPCALQNLSNWSTPIQWPEDTAMPNTVITILPPGSRVSFATDVEISYIADKKVLCWYWINIKHIHISFIQLVPQRCGLGRRVSSTFVTDKYNPCTERMTLQDQSCLRIIKNATCEAPNVTCANWLNCTNGATLQQEGDLCWCNCSLQCQGSLNCSVCHRTTTLPPPPTLCPNGVPLDNWCAKALPNAANPCRNGGTCINQCTNFVCKCTMPNVMDKLCNLFPM